VSHPTLNEFVVSVCVGTVPLGDVVVLMHSTMSTCPRVGAICYPQFLGITKEMMYRGPQVVDMEYRETS
jgi:hypothetical protein